MVGQSIRTASAYEIVITFGLAYVPPTPLKIIAVRARGYLITREVNMFKKTKEDLRRLMELRRSNSASPIRNKKKYTRKIKHKDRDNG